MSIELACRCGKTFRVKDEYAGKKGKCPKCGHVLVIPEPIVELEPEPEPDEYDLAGTDPGEYGLAEMLDEALTAPGFSGAGSSSVGGAGGGGLELRIQADVPMQFKREVEGIVEECLQRHFAVAKDRMRRGYLEVRVFEWDDDPEEPSLAIFVAGTVGNGQINRKFRGHLPETQSGGFFGGRKKGRGASLTPFMRSLVEETLDDVCLAMDKAAGGSLLPVSQIWNVLTTAQLVVGFLLGALAARMVWNALPPGEYYLMLVVGLPFIITACFSIAALHGICAFFMPDSFFIRDPRGRRILERFNVRTPRGLRMVLLSGCAVMAGVLILGFFFVRGFIEGYDEAKNRRTEAPRRQRREFTPPKFDIPRPDLAPLRPPSPWSNPPDDTAEWTSDPDKTAPSSPGERRSPFPTAPYQPPSIPGPGPGFGRPGEGPRLPGPPSFDPDRHGPRLPGPPSFDPDRHGPRMPGPPSFGPDRNGPRMPGPSGLP